MSASFGTPWIDRDTNQYHISNITSPNLSIDITNVSMLNTSRNISIIDQSNSNTTYTLLSNLTTTKQGFYKLVYNLNSSATSNVHILNNMGIVQTTKSMQPGAMETAVWENSKWLVPYHAYIPSQNGVITSLDVSGLVTSFGLQVTASAITPGVGGTGKTNLPRGCLLAADTSGIVSVPELKWDASNERLGVRLTTDPNYKLDVTGDIACSEIHCLGQTADHFILNTEVLHEKKAHPVLGMDTELMIVNTASNVYNHENAAFIGDFMWPKVVADSSYTYVVARWTDAYPYNGTYLGDVYGSLSQYASITTSYVGFTALVKFAKKRFSWTEALMSLWAAGIAGADPIGYSVAVGPNGRVCVCCRKLGGDGIVRPFNASGKGQYDAQRPTTTAIDSSLANSYITSFDASGRCQWVCAVSNCDAPIIDMDCSGNVYLGGHRNNLTMPVTIYNASGTGQVASTNVRLYHNQASLDMLAFCVKFNTSGCAEWVTGMRGKTYVGDLNGATKTADLKVSNSLDVIWAVHNTATWTSQVQGQSLSNTIATLTPYTYLYKINKSGNFVASKKLAYWQGDQSVFEGMVNISMNKNSGEFLHTTVRQTAFRAYRSEVSHYAADLSVKKTIYVGNTRASAAVLDASGNIYVCGRFNDISDVVLSPEIKIRLDSEAAGDYIDRIFSSEGDSTYLVKYNSSGDYVAHTNISPYFNYDPPPTNKYFRVAAVTTSNILYTTQFTSPESLQSLCVDGNNIWLVALTNCKVLVVGNYDQRTVSLLSPYHTLANVILFKFILTSQNSVIIPSPPIWNFTFPGNPRYVVNNTNSKLAVALKQRANTARTYELTPHTYMRAIWITDKPQYSQTINTWVSPVSNVDFTYGRIAISGSLNIQTTAKLRYMWDYLAVNQTHNGLFVSPLDVSGNVFTTHTVVQMSDQRVKSNIQPIEKPLEKLNFMRGHTYRLLDTTGSQRAAGLIAQDVEHAFPAAAVCDASGMLSVAYNNLVALLVSAVGELKQQLDMVKHTRHASV